MPARGSPGGCATVVCSNTRGGGGREQEMVGARLIRRGEAGQRAVASGHRNLRRLALGPARRRQRQRHLRRAAAAAHREGRQAAGPIVGLRLAFAGVQPLGVSWRDGRLAQQQQKAPSPRCKAPAALIQRFSAPAQPSNPNRARRAACRTRASA